MVSIFQSFLAIGTSGRNYFFMRHHQEKKALKGQCHEISDVSFFFYETAPPWPIRFAESFNKFKIYTGLKIKNTGDGRFHFFVFLQSYSHLNAESIRNKDVFNF